MAIDPPPPPPPQTHMRVFQAALVALVFACGQRELTSLNFRKTNENFSSYSLYYAEACKESMRLPASELFSKNCFSGGEPLATLNPI